MWPAARSTSPAASSPKTSASPGSSCTLRSCAPASAGWRPGTGGMTPTTFATGYLYAGMGWTTVNEAAVPILSAKHTHEEMHDIPIVDKSTLLLMATTDIMVD